MIIDIEITRQDLINDLRIVMDRAIDGTLTDGQMEAILGVAANYAVCYNADIQGIILEKSNRVLVGNRFYLQPNDEDYEDY